MNKLKEKKEAEPVKEQPQERPVRSKNKLLLSIGSVFSGTILTREKTIEQMPFLFFLVFMAICYISNGYYAEQKIREMNFITTELKELKSEYIISKSDLMFISKQSEVAKAAEPLGIKESVVPPKKILVKIIQQPTGKD